jgi:SEC-C motif-containing protein
MSKNNKPCPCGGPSLEECCGRFLSKENSPETAEQLMRSRYTAYVTSNEDYLKASWHPSTCPSEQLTDASIKWLALELRSAEEQGDEATVEFVARCRVSGRGHRLHETSRFVREAGQWLYLDGTFEKNDKGQ